MADTGAVRIDLSQWRAIGFSVKKGLSLGIRDRVRDMIGIKNRLE